MARPCRPPLQVCSDSGQRSLDLSASEPDSRSWSKPPTSRTKLHNTPRPQQERSQVLTHVIERIHKLAQQFMREGFVDNEPDARLAAIRVLVAAERVGHAPSVPSEQEQSDDSAQD